MHACTARRHSSRRLATALAHTDAPCLPLHSLAYPDHTANNDLGAAALLLRILASFSSLHPLSFASPSRRRCCCRCLSFAMGGSFSHFFGPKIDRNILLLGREGVGKTYLLYRLKGLTTQNVGQ